MKNYKPYQTRILLLLLSAFSMVKSQQAPNPAAAVAPAPSSIPDPTAVPAPAPTVVPTPTAEAVAVPPPSWPDTVELDKKTESIFQGVDVQQQKDLYKQAQGLLKTMSEVVIELEKIRESSFNDYLKLNDVAEKNIRDISDKLGRFKEFLAEKI